MCLGISTIVKNENSEERNGQTVKVSYRKDVLWPSKIKWEKGRYDKQKITKPLFCISIIHLYIL